MFNTGRQPCKNFSPENESRLERGYLTIWQNLQQCVYCDNENTVSYCLNCNKDHHEKGYENCKRAIVELQA